MPANQGGTNYRAKVARASRRRPAYPPTPPTAAALPMTTQVSHTSDAGVDPGALHCVWGGAKRHLHRTRPRRRPGRSRQPRRRRTSPQAATQYVQQVAAAAGRRRAEHPGRAEHPRHRQDPRDVAAGAAAWRPRSRAIVGALQHHGADRVSMRLGGNVMRVDSARHLERGARQPGGLRLHEHDAHGLRSARPWSVRAVQPRRAERQSHLRLRRWRASDRCRRTRSSPNPSPR